jgi:hypothetical protein
MGYALRLPLMSNVRAHLRMFRVLATLVISLPAMAVDQTAAAEAQLGSLFVEDCVETQAKVCAERIPAVRAAWSSALTEWKNRNKEELNEMRSLSQQVAAILQRHGREGDFVAFRAQAVVLPLHAIASYRDQEAEWFCERLRSQLLDESMSARIFREARAAVAVTIANAEPSSK